ITRFTAPHDDATLMCIETGKRPTEEREEFITAYEGRMLGRFSLEPGMTGCEVWADSGHGARVFISADDPASVTVLNYRLPSR
ncbi:hypothetical protein, partial [Cellulomonas bogoriensis]|uniref:hypothetical protein n=1 Tax=Cellulomonas bogoriensis TaxID=301388 RepID=UPI001E385749